MRRNRKYQIGDVFTTKNHGEFVIISFEQAGFYKIKFLKTGTEKIVNTSSITSKQIKDKRNPFVYNKGYIGDWKKPNFARFHPLYDRWKSILSRCYNHKCKDYKSYGAKNIYVEDFLLDFTNFVQFVEQLTNYNNLIDSPLLWDIDKDFLSKDGCNKSYSRDNILIISKKLNSSYKSKKK